MIIVLGVTQTLETFRFYICVANLESGNAPRIGFTFPNFGFFDFLVLKAILFFTSNYDLKNVSANFCFFFFRLIASKPSIVIWFNSPPVLINKSSSGKTTLNCAECLLKTIGLGVLIFL